MKPGRVSNLLPLNLPQLQNLIKRDPEGYRAEFELQWRHLQSCIDAFRLQPSQPDVHLEQLVGFVAQVANCYRDLCDNFASTLVQLLQELASVIEPSLRMCFCRQLVLLHGRGQVSLLQLLELALQLLASCADRQLRQYWHVQLVAAVRNGNRRRCNQHLNKPLQNHLFRLLSTATSSSSSATVSSLTTRLARSSVVVKASLDLAVELYRRDVWRDARTVNAIAEALFSRVAKVSVAALQFFLGHDDDRDDGEDGSDNSDGSSADEGEQARAVVAAAKYNRKTRKRQKQLSKARALVHRSRKRRKRAEPFNYSALHFLHDPQGLAERLYRRLESLHERYEVKLLHMSLLARLIGVHRLLVLNFYPYLQRYLQPKQRDVTRVLQYTAQACHDLVPPETVDPLLSSIANNFVTERNSAEVITVGINAVKEIAARTPLALSTELLHDLCAYKRYRDKNVVMAARGLIQLFREVQPQLLARQDRGRPTEASGEVVALQYGSVAANNPVPGVEILSLNNQSRQDDEDSESDQHDEDDDDGWINVSSDGEQSAASSCDSIDGEEEVTRAADTDVEHGVGHDLNACLDSGCDSPHSPVDEKHASSNVPDDSQLSQQQNSASGVAPGDDKTTRALAVLSSRILSDADFRRIDRAQLAKHLDPLKKSRSNSKSAADSEIVSLRQIEQFHKRVKGDKANRFDIRLNKKLERSDMKFGRPKGRVNQHASTTNSEKRKKKSFMMVRDKLKSKKKKSFQEKQRNLQQALLKRQKKTKY